METKIKKKFAEMEMDRNAIFKTIKSLDDEYLNRPPEEGKWSIIQILHHLMDAESQSLNYIQKKTQSPEKLKKAGFSEWIKSKILNYYLKAPKKWKAPPMVSEVPENDSLENTKQRYADTRKQWKDFLEEMPDDWAKKKVFRHPVSGRLDMHMTLDFLDLHAKRHFKQIHSIVNDQLRITK